MTLAFGRLSLFSVVRGAGDMMISRARSYGSQAYFKQAQELKVPSCENLARIGITKYMPY